VALSLKLPTGDGTENYVLVGASQQKPATAPHFNRVVYAAAHVVSDVRASQAPWSETHIDWDSTLRFRHHLWSLGFKVAEAMDTSQRGMGLDWEGAQQLISRSLQEAKSVSGADLACGAGTDQLSSLQVKSLDDVIRAYEEQFEFIEKHCGRPIMMASRALAKVARGPDDYLKVYSHMLAKSKNPVILHWLGDMFDSALIGYWGSSDFASALKTVLAIIGENTSKVEGIKISLLNEAYELELRKSLPQGVLCFTGDDFNYAPLIEGDGQQHSHALLGIFDAVALPAANALSALANGNTGKFHDIIRPTVPLSRKIFEAPAQYYKAGVVFLAWLNGHQDHFIMPAGMQSARSCEHYAEVFRLADVADALDRPDLAVWRMRSLMSTYGVE
jgi:hypothetical protein